MSTGSKFPYRPRVIPEQTEWEIGVFPFMSVNGRVVTWNSVVRRRDPGQERWTVHVLPALDSPELAKANAENWLRSHRNAR